MSRVDETGVTHERKETNQAIQMTRTSTSSAEANEANFSSPSLETQKYAATQMTTTYLYFIIWERRSQVMLS